MSDLGWTYDFDSSFVDSPNEEDQWEKHGIFRRNKVTGELRLGEIEGALGGLAADYVGSDESITLGFQTSAGNILTEDEIDQNLWSGPRDAEAEGDSWLKSLGLNTLGSQQQAWGGRTVGFAASVKDIEAGIVGGGLRLLGLDDTSLGSAVISRMENNAREMRDLGEAVQKEAEQNIRDRGDDAGIFKNIMEGDFLEALDQAAFSGTAVAADLALTRGLGTSSAILASGKKVQDVTKLASNITAAIYGVDAFQSAYLNNREGGGDRVESFATAAITAGTTAALERITQNKMFGGKSIDDLVEKKRILGAALTESGVEYAQGVVQAYGESAFDDSVAWDSKFLSSTLYNAIDDAIIGGGIGAGAAALAGTANKDSDKPRREISASQMSIKEKENLLIDMGHIRRSFDAIVSTDGASITPQQENSLKYFVKKWGHVQEAKSLLLSAMGDLLDPAKRAAAADLKSTTSSQVYGNVPGGTTRILDDESVHPTSESYTSLSQAYERIKAPANAESAGQWQGESESRMDAIEWIANNEVMFEQAKGASILESIREMVAHDKAKMLSPAQRDRAVKLAERIAKGTSGIADPSAVARALKDSMDADMAFTAAEDQAGIDSVLDELYGTDLPADDPGALLAAVDSAVTKIVNDHGTNLSSAQVEKLSNLMRSALDKRGKFLPDSPDSYYTLYDSVARRVASILPTSHASPANLDPISGREFVASIQQAERSYLEDMRHSVKLAMGIVGALDNAELIESAYAGNESASMVLESGSVGAPGVYGPSSEGQQAFLGIPGLGYRDILRIVKDNRMHRAVLQRMENLLTKEELVEMRHLLKTGKPLTDGFKFDWRSIGARADKLAWDQTALWAHQRAVALGAVGQGGTPVTAGQNPTAAVSEIYKQRVLRHEIARRKAAAAYAERLKQRQRAAEANNVNSMLTNDIEEAGKRRAAVSEVKKKNFEKDLESKSQDQLWEDYHEKKAELEKEWKLHGQLRRDKLAEVTNKTAKIDQRPTGRERVAAIRENGVALRNAKIDLEAKIEAHGEAKVRQGLLRAAPNPDENAMEGASRALSAAELAVRRQMDVIANLEAQREDLRRQSEEAKKARVTTDDGRRIAMTSVKPGEIVRVPRKGWFFADEHSALVGPFESAERARELAPSKGRLSIVEKLIASDPAIVESKKRINELTKQVSQAIARARATRSKRRSENRRLVELLNSLIGDMVDSEVKSRKDAERSLNEAKADFYEATDLIRSLVSESLTDYEALSKVSPDNVMKVLADKLTNALYAADLLPRRKAWSHASIAAYAEHFKLDPESEEIRKSYGEYMKALSKGTAAPIPTVVYEPLDHAKVRQLIIASMYEVVESTVPGPDLGAKVTDQSRRSRINFEALKIPGLSDVMPSEIIEADKIVRTLASSMVFGKSKSDKWGKLPFGTSLKVLQDVDEKGNKIPQTEEQKSLSRIATAIDAIRTRNFTRKLLALGKDHPGVVGLIEELTSPYQTVRTVGDDANVERHDAGAWVKGRYDQLRRDVANAARVEMENLGRSVFTSVEDKGIRSERKGGRDSFDRDFTKTAQVEAGEGKPQEGRKYLDQVEAEVIDTTRTRHGEKWTKTESQRDEESTIWDPARIASDAKFSPKLRSEASELVNLSSRRTASLRQFYQLATAAGFRISVDRTAMNGDPLTDLNAARAYDRVETLYNNVGAAMRQRSTPTGLAYNLVAKGYSTDDVIHHLGLLSALAETHSQNTGRSKHEFYSRIIGTLGWDNPKDQSHGEHERGSHQSLASILLKGMDPDEQDPSQKITNKILSSMAPIHELIHGLAESGLLAEMLTKSQKALFKTWLGQDLPTVGRDGKIARHGGPLNAQKSEAIVNAIIMSVAGRNAPKELAPAVKNLRRGMLAYMSSQFAKSDIPEISGLRIMDGAVPQELEDVLVGLFSPDMGERFLRVANNRAIAFAQIAIAEGIKREIGVDVTSLLEAGSLRSGELIGRMLHVIDKSDLFYADGSVADSIRDFNSFVAAMGLSDITQEEKAALAGPHKELVLTLIEPSKSAALLASRADSRLFEMAPKKPPQNTNASPAAFGDIVDDAKAAVVQDSTPLANSSLDRMMAGLDEMLGILKKDVFTSGEGDKATSLKQSVGNWLRATGRKWEQLTDSRTAGLERTLGMLGLSSEFLRVHNMGGLYAQAQSNLEWGVVVDDGFTRKIINEPLSAIISEIPEEMYNDVFRYMAAMREIEIANWNAVKVAEHERRVENWEKNGKKGPKPRPRNVKKTGEDNIKAANVVKFYMEAKYGKDGGAVGQFAERISKFGRSAVIDKLHYYGMLSDEDHRNMTEQGKHWIPLYSIEELVESSGMAPLFNDGTRSGMKRLEADLKNGIEHPLNNIARTAVSAHLFAERQRVRSALLKKLVEGSSEEDLKAMGIERAMITYKDPLTRQEVTEPVSRRTYPQWATDHALDPESPVSRTFAAWDGGNADYYIIHDNELLSSIESLMPEELQGAMKLMKGFGNVITGVVNTIGNITKLFNMAITLSPQFIFNMPFKDAQSALVKSQTGLTLFDFFGGFKDALPEFIPGLAKEFPNAFKAYRERASSLAQQTSLQVTYADEGRPMALKPSVYVPETEGGTFSRAAKAFKKSVVDPRLAKSKEKLFGYQSHHGQSLWRKTGYVLHVSTGMTVDFFKNVGSLTDAGIRMAERRLAREGEVGLVNRVRGSKRIAKMKKEGTPQSPEFLYSDHMVDYLDRMITLDFARRGALTSLVAKFKMFAGPTFQDWNQTIKMGNQPGMLRPLIMKGVLNFTVPALINYARFWDDEEWQNLTYWDKFNYLHITKGEDGKFVKIPWGIGLLSAVFKDFPIAVAQFLSEQDPDAFREWTDQFYNQTPLQYLPMPKPGEGTYMDDLGEWAISGNPLLPTALEPVAEVAANYDPFTNSKIDWDVDREKARLPEDRGLEKAGVVEAMLARTGVWGLSVPQWSHLARGYLPGLAGDIYGVGNQMATEAYKAAGGDERVGVTYDPWSKATFNFKTRSPYGPASLPVNRLASMYTRSSQARTTYRDLVSRGASSRAESILSKYPELLYYNGLKKAYNKVTALKVDRAKFIKTYGNMLTKDELEEMVRVQFDVPMTLIANDMINVYNDQQRGMSRTIKGD